MINLYFGPVVNPKTLTHFDALPRCLIAVGPDGNIVWIESDVKPSAVPEVIALYGLDDGDYVLVDFCNKPGEFIMPGLVDTHVHACQFPILGVGGDDQLLDWLRNSVFPTEKLFKEEEYARRVYQEVIHRSIASGTTTSCYYGSLHLSSNIILADIVHAKGQRAFVGKCNMDWDCPGDYIDESAETSVNETIMLIGHIQGLSPSSANEPLVHPVITPRFALSCSDKLLVELGKLATSLPHVAIQTHICENRKEVSDVLKRFDAESYAEVYDRFGLLRHNTILGHGVWLSNKDIALIAKRNAGVAHCPASNFFLGSGMAKVGLLLDNSIKVGLGTDVSGGNNPSLLYAIQMASTVSKMVALQADLDEEHRQNKCRRKDRKHGKHDKHGRRHAHEHTDSSDSDSDLGGEDHRQRRHQKYDAHVRRDHNGHHNDHCHRAPRPTPQFMDQKLKLDALVYLATLGGANVLSLQDRIGSFAVGKAFDALYVSLTDDDARDNPAVWGQGVDAHEHEHNETNMRRWLERFLFGGDNRNVRRVFVQGTAIGGVDVATNTRKSE